MAMAHCSTCGNFGNFTKCPNRFDRDDDGRWYQHRVQFDEVYNDDNTTNDNNDSDGGREAGNGREPR